MFTLYIVLFDWIFDESMPEDDGESGAIRLFQPEVMPRINKRVLDAPSYWDALYLDLTDTKPCQMKSSSQFYQLSEAEYNQCIMRRIRYITRTGRLYGL